MIRRLLALYTVFCLALSFHGTLSTSQQIVCRMTGMPMAARANVVATDTSQGCCGHKKTAIEQPQDTAADTIGNPPCCQVRPAPEKAPAPAAVVPPAADLIAWAPTVAVLPAPLTARIVTTSHYLPAQTAPHGPPDCTTPSRAPPFFS